MREPLHLFVSWEETLLCMLLYSGLISRCMLTYGGMLPPALQIYTVWDLSACRHFELFCVDTEMAHERTKFCPVMLRTLFICLPFNFTRYARIQRCINNSITQQLHNIFAASEYSLSEFVALVSLSSSEHVTQGCSPAMLGDANRNWEWLCSVGMWGRWGGRERGGCELILPSAPMQPQRSSGQSCSDKTKTPGCSLSAQWPEHVGVTFTVCSVS